MTETLRSWIACDFARWTPLWMLDHDEADEILVGVLVVEADAIATP
jgi:hypothetical protein